MLVTRPASLADVSVIQALAHQMTAHLHTCDPRLPAEISLPVWMIFIDGGACWLASRDGQPAGVLCAEPETWYEDSPFANVFPRSYLRLRLSLDASVDPQATVAILLAETLAWSGAAESEGCLLMAPRADLALSAALEAVGFRPYHTIAAQPLHPLTAPPPPPGITIRRATRRDVLPVAGLMAELWRFHAAHQPAIRLSPQIIAGCEQQARQLTTERDSQVLLLAERERGHRRLLRDRPQPPGPGDAPGVVRAWLVRRHLRSRRAGRPAAGRDRHGAVPCRLGLVRGPGRLQRVRQLRPHQPDQQPLLAPPGLRGRLDQLVATPYRQPLKP